MKHMMKLAALLLCAALLFVTPALAEEEWSGVYVFNMPMPVGGYFADGVGYGESHTAPDAEKYIWVEKVEEGTAYVHMKDTTISVTGESFPYPPLHASDVSLHLTLEGTNLIDASAAFGIDCRRPLTISGKTPEDSLTIKNVGMAGIYSGPLGVSSPTSGITIQNCSVTIENVQEASPLGAILTVNDSGKANYIQKNANVTINNALRGITALGGDIEITGGKTHIHNTAGGALGAMAGEIRLSKNLQIVKPALGKVGTNDVASFIADANGEPATTVHIEPGAAVQPSVPSTGDSANLVLWLGMLAVSGVGIALLNRKRRSA